jgi:uncharacterized membrane protein YebE (DUF533 family)
MSSGNEVLAQRAKAIADRIFAAENKKFGLGGDMWATLVDNKDKIAIVGGIAVLGVAAGVGWWMWKKHKDEKRDNN